MIAARGRDTLVSAICHISVKGHALQLYEVACGILSRCVNKNILFYFACVQGLRAFASKPFPYVVPIVAKSSQLLFDEAARCTRVSHHM